MEPAFALEHCEFLQIIRLLEQAEPHRPAVGVSPEPNNEVVRFRGRVDFGFPSRQVDGLVATHAEPGQGPAYELTSRMLMLLGRFGTLPAVYSEQVMQRLAQGDQAGRDFLDLFHHRLVTLWIKICKAIQPELNLTAAHESDYMKQLNAINGLGLACFSTQEGGVDPALNAGVGLPVRARITAADLAQLVAFHFDVPCRVRPFVGEWISLRRDDCARLSAFDGALLGRRGALGSRAWDANGRFAVVLGPLAPGRFRDFLPDGVDHARLCRLVRFHAGPDLVFSIVLSPQKQSVAGACLSAGGGDALGWTACLSTASPTVPPAVTLFPDRAASECDGR